MQVPEEARKEFQIAWGWSVKADSSELPMTWMLNAVDVGNQTQVPDKSSMCL